MTPTWQSEDGSIRLVHGDCLSVLGELEAGSVDSIVCDPPYGLTQNKKGGSGEASLNEKSPAGRSRVTTGGGFMGQKWDAGVPGVPFWEAALRVAKPGAHLLAFGGTRTFHRLACAIEDAGWELRDTVMWVYGSGFPKSLNVQQAINKAARGCPQGGADPSSPNHGKFKGGCSDESPNGRGFGAGAGAFMQEQGKARGGDDGQWQGYGTALKPAWEPIILARKPLTSTVAGNVQRWGTGALNIDGCRIGTDGGGTHCTNRDESGKCLGHPDRSGTAFGLTYHGPDTSGGRWPANLIHDGSDEVVGLFPTSSTTGKRTAGSKAAKVNGTAWGTDNHESQEYTDSGSAARFFYCAKASKRDRDEGCEGLPQTLHQSVAHGDKHHGTLPYTNEPREMKPRPRGNHHPTVKPTDLMRYLCRLVTPPGGVVCDPFMGSGSTGKAAVLEGFRFTGIEMEAEYIAIAKARMRHALGEHERRLFA